MSWAVPMSRPEPSDNVVNTDYATRGPSEFYRQARAGAAEGVESAPRGDLSRLRQSLGPQPEIVHVPQPTRRFGWFASGFAIALVFGVVIGWLVIAQFPSLSGKAPGSGTKSSEFTTRFDNPTSPRVAQSPNAGVPIAPTAAQPANAPARLSTVGGANEPAPTVRGVTDSEIRVGMSAPFSGPAKELGQNMKLGIEAAFNAVNANGGVHGRQLQLFLIGPHIVLPEFLLDVGFLARSSRLLACLFRLRKPRAQVAQALTDLHRTINDTLNALQRRLALVFTLVAVHFE